MEIPSARVLDDGVLRFGHAQAMPYRWYSMAMGVFPGLEFNVRLTEMTNISGGLGEDYGTAKDKAFDLKYQLIPESKRFPAISFGLRDIYGKSQLFHSLGLLKTEFNEHLNVLFNFSKEQKQIILDNWSDIEKCKTNKERYVIIEKIISLLDIHFESANQVIYVLRAISDYWDPFDDTAENLLNDMKQSSILPNDKQKREEAISFFQSFYQILENIKNDQLIKTIGGRRR